MTEGDSPINMDDGWQRSLPQDTAPHLLLRYVDAIQKDMLARLEYEDRLIDQMLASLEARLNKLIEDADNRFAGNKQAREEIEKRVTIMETAYSKAQGNIEGRLWALGIGIGLFSVVSALVIHFLMP